MAGLGFAPAAQGFPFELMQIFEQMFPIALCDPLAVRIHGFLAARNPVNPPPATLAERSPYEIGHGMILAHPYCSG